MSPLKCNERMSPLDWSWDVIKLSRKELQRLNVLSFVVCYPRADKQQRTALKMLLRGEGRTSPKPHDTANDGAEMARCLDRAPSGD
jgi:hypothetical protein